MCKKMIKNYSLLAVVIMIITACSQSDYQNKLPSGSDSRSFDSVVWQDELSTDPDENLVSEREKMLKDLIDNVLPGKNKSEIEQLLGPSLETQYFASEDKDLIYYMGPERDSIFTVDSEWLLIWLDDSGKFNKYQIKKD